MSNIIEQTENAELVKIISESGIEPSKSEEIKQSYLPYFIQIAEVKEQALKINRENPTDIDEKIARELRLKMVKIRTGSEQVKDNRKKVHLLAGNLEQSAWNLIKTGCMLEEELFLQVEKRSEIAEKARKEALKVERSEALAPYEIDATHLSLGEMSEDVWNNFLSGTKTGFENKKEAERLAEQKRVEEERILKLHNSRKNSMISSWQFFPEAFKDKNLGEMSEDVWSDIESKTSSAKAEYDNQQAEIAAENKRLKEEADKREKELKDQQEKAAEDKRKADAELKKQQDENKRIADELQKKKDNEAAAKKAEDDRIAAEKKAQAASDRKAKRAPDKKKIAEAVNQMSLFPIELKTEESQAVYTIIQAKFEAFKMWAKEQIETI